MGKCMTEYVDKLVLTGNLSKEELSEMLRFRNTETTEYLFEQAMKKKEESEKKEVRLLGRIPISSYCRYNCNMCGLRRGNQFAKRYRMNVEEVLACCNAFADAGVNRFLLESGDDVYYNEERVAMLIMAIKEAHPDSVVYLALGEKSASAYQKWKQLGAAGYLFSHGCANDLQFRKLYPGNMSLLLRKQIIWGLREAGYMVGGGFLVGIPYQKIDTVIDDICFMKAFGMDIVDMGAFIPAMHTQFETQRSGNGEMTLYIMAMMRLMFPQASIIVNPTLDCVLKDGRMRGLDAAADTFLLDVTQEDIRKNYSVYDKKNGRWKLPADNIEEITAMIKQKGYALE